MKKIIFTLVFYYSLFITHYSLSQWVWQNPMPSASALGRAYFLNINTGWIPSAYGKISKTTNGGLKWIDQSLENGNNISGLFFIDSQTGWAVGSNGMIIKSTNGGKNWAQQTSSSTGALYCVYFINSQTGWIGGAWNNFLRTTNGGNNWIFSNQIGDEIYCMSFVNSLTGWLSCSNAHIHKTTDGGVTFQTTITQNFYNTYVNFKNENTGWVSGANGGYGLYKTTDGGSNWFVCPFPNNNVGGSPIYFKDVNTGWVASTTKLLKTTDGGLNWNDSTNCASFLSFIYFSDVNTGFIGGSASELYSTPCMYKTTNGGTNWQNLVSGINYSFKSVSIVNPNTVFVAGDYNTIVKSTNGGEYWDFNNYTIKNNDGKNISSVFFINEQTGWAASYDYSIYYGLLFKTTNSGLNWYEVDSNYQRMYTDIFFVNQNTGYATGNNVIKKSTNGGTNWFDVIGASKQNYYQSLYFINDATGWVAVSNFNGASKIIKTTNGGLVWYTQNIPINNSRISSIQFINQNTGFAAGYFNGILKTSNGGNNWFLANDSITGILSIYFFDANRGWAVGHYGSGMGNGLIAKTINGGTNWEILRQKTNWSLNCVKFINDNTGWIVGNTGVILKTSTGGLTFEQIQEANIPVNYKLFQNYPNPFNPVTIIRYMIAENGKQKTENGLVTLKVYDILGKEIATLVNEKQSPRTYEVTWDASVYPSGVYFYKLTSGDFSETKKTLLIK